MLFRNRKYTEKRRGIPIPRGVNRFKTVLFLILVPLLTWYSKQAVNNPWQMRSCFYFDENAIVLFQESNKDKTDKFIFPINQILNENIDIHGWKIRPRFWGISVVCSDTNIVIADKNLDKRNNAPIFCDILVSVADDVEKLKEERLFFRPKLTIWFAKEGEHSPAPNVYIPKQNEKFRVAKQKNKFKVQ